MGYAGYHKGLLGFLEGQSKKEPEQGALDHHRAVNRGIRGLEGSINGSLSGKGNSHYNPEEGHREALKSKLKDITANPEQLLDVGSDLTEMPEQAGILAGHVAQAVNYLASLAPQPVQMGPLDAVMQPSKPSEEAYDRQIDIANHPKLIIQHMQDGTLQPKDLTTLKTVYPGLFTAMQTKLMDELVATKTRKETIPAKRQRTLSMFLGQPLSFIQTPAAAQAIIASQAQVAQNRALGQPQKKKRTGATEAQLSTIEKTNALYPTDSQARQLNERKR